MDRRRRLILVLPMVLAGLVGACGDAAEMSRPPLTGGSLVFDEEIVPTMAFDAPYGVDVSSQGRIHVLDAGNDRVVVFDAAGTEVAIWGGTGDAPGQLQTLGFGALAIGPDDRLYVVDNGNHRVQVFDAEGQVQTTFGTQGEGEGAFLRAIGIAVTDTEVHVTDDGVAWVSVFDLEGAYLRRYGGPDVLQHATGIAAAPDGSTYVADYEGEQVLRFSADGTLEGTWVDPGPAGTFDVPEGLVVDADGTVLVTGYRSGELQLLPITPGEEGWPLATGESPPGSPRLLAPVDVAIAPDGSVVVADQRGSRVLRFVRAPDATATPSS